MITSHDIDRGAHQDPPSRERIIPVLLDGKASWD